MTVNYNMHRSNPLADSNDWRTFEEWKSFGFLIYRGSKGKWYRKICYFHKSQVIHSNEPNASAKAMQGRDTNEAIL